MDTNSLPNTIIIGAMKCATTSLHYYLDQHPEIHMSKIKELWFFVEGHTGQHSIQWYSSHFDRQLPIRGEASTGYTMYPQFRGVPARMHRQLPHAKLIYIIRDPIERIISHYTHLLAIGEENRPFEQAIGLTQLDPDNHYLAFSQYYRQLEKYFPYYPQENIYILTTESLMHKRLETIAGIFRFLNVDSQFTSPKFHHIKHSTQIKRRLSPAGQRLRLFSEARLNRHAPNLQRAIIRYLCIPLSSPIQKIQINSTVREQLTEALRPDVQKLRTATGQSFDEWSI